MKKATILLSSCFMVVTIMTSCTKTSQPSTPYSQLYGKWKIVQEASDDTNTGVLDSNQIYTLTANDVESFTFNKDSTGTHYITFDGNNNNYNFRWSLVSNFSNIQMITAGGDTITAKIVSFYGPNLTLMNYTKPLSWYILKQQ